MNRAELKDVILRSCEREGFPADITDIFVSLKKDAAVAEVLQRISNQFQHMGNDLLYDLISAVYSSHERVFQPQFKYAVDDALFDDSRPRMCLGLHSKFSPLTARLVQQDLKFVVVSDFPEMIQRVAFSSGVRAEKIKFIKRNQNCLLHAKNFLQKNHLVSSTIDFTSKVPGPFDRLSDSMLKLAKYTRPLTFFGLNCVNDQAEMTYIAQKLDMDQGLESVKEALAHFIAAHKSHGKFHFGAFNYQQQTNLLETLKPAS